eukprot:scaffold40726_cov48-Phaeocystis_antarctica.AAC.1
MARPAQDARGGPSRDIDQPLRLAHLVRAHGHAACHAVRIGSSAHARTAAPAAHLQPGHRRE